MSRIPSFLMRPPTSERIQVLLRAGVFAVAVALERRRIARGSPRRVRRVDARTGADPSLRQTIIVLGTQRAVPWLLARATPGPGAELQRIKPEIERMRLEYPDDPSARQEALTRVSQRRQGAQVGCLLMVVRIGATLTINRCPLPFLPERQTLADLLAGTKLVRNGASRPRRASGR
jgi:hypothetical protein